MRNFSIFVTLFIFSLSSSFGQVEGDSITMKKTFGGYQFYQNEKLLTMNQLVKTMESNQEAYKVIKSAQSNNTLAQILGGVGGFLVGWPIGTALGGGEPNWTLAGIGAGVIVVAIPVSQKANKQSKRAVDIYNEKYRASSFLDETEVDFVFRGNSLGLTFTF